MYKEVREMLKDMDEEDLVWVEDSLKDLEKKGTLELVRKEDKLLASTITKSDRILLNYLKNNITTEFMGTAQISGKTEDVVEDLKGEWIDLNKVILTKSLDRLMNLNLLIITKNSITSSRIVSELKVEKTVGKEYVDEFEISISKNIFKEL